MPAGETAGTQGRGGIDAEQGIAGGGDNIDKVALESFCSGEFAETDFGGNLPGRGSRDDDLVGLVSNDDGRSAAEEFWGEDSPKESVSVEENPHFLALRRTFFGSSFFGSSWPFQRRSSCSGSGSKKALVSTKPGVSRAPRRLRGTASIASNLATGVRLRPEVIITVSPIRAFFTSSERLVFASKMVAEIMGLCLLVYVS
jgi:hypothetical protein